MNVSIPQKKQFYMYMHLMTEDKNMRQKLIELQKTKKKKRKIHYYPGI